MTSDRTNGPLLCVTMTPEAAEHFKKALLYAESRIYPHAPPITDKDMVAYEHAEWLRWGHARVASGEIDES